MPLSFPLLPLLTTGHPKPRASPTSMSRLAGWLQEQMLPSLQRVPTIGIKPPRMLTMLRFRASRTRLLVSFLKPTVTLPARYSMVSTGSPHPALMSTFQPKTDGQPTMVITLLTALSLSSLSSKNLSTSRTPWLISRCRFTKLMMAQEFRALLSQAGKSLVVAQTLASAINSPLISSLKHPGMAREATQLLSFLATTPK